MGRWQNVSLSDGAFFRAPFSSLGLFRGCLAQKKGLESIKAPGILIFSQRKEEDHGRPGSLFFSVPHKPPAPSLSAEVSLDECLLN